MKEVKITIDGKEYAKTHPMVQDWKNMLEYQAANKERNLVLDAEPLTAIISIVAEYVGAPEEKIADKCPLDMIMDAYRAIDANIFESFTGASSEKNAEGRQRPKK